MGESQEDIRRQTPMTSWDREVQGCFGSDSDMLNNVRVIRIECKIDSSTYVPIASCRFCDLRPTRSNYVGVLA